MSNQIITKSLLAALLAVSLSGCATSTPAGATESDETVTVTETVSVGSSDKTSDKLGGAADGVSAETGDEAEQTDASETLSTASLSMATDGVIDTRDLFTERDLAQTADTSNATYVTLTSGSDVEITSEGVYVISGTATDVTIRVAAEDTDKVQIVLDGVSIENSDSPCIYVVSADKVFVTTVGENSLSVTGTFSADGDTNTDAVIFSKEDLTLNGTGTLTISSTDNGVTSKDDLKVTGGTIVISCQSDGLEANDSVRIAGGDITIVTPKDGIHVEYDEDDSVGFAYICGGTLSIQAGDDGIHATTYLQIDGGDIEITAAEALEATYVQVNGGSIDIAATDDGINASYKSKSMGTPCIEIRGGELAISMAQGDTDALDSNGYLVVSGGTIDITAQFAFDFELGSEFTGGTIYVNGEQVTQITESMMMGGGMMGGDPMGGAMEGGPMGGMQGGPGQMGGGPGGGW